MHWVLGKRRPQSGSAEETARRTAHATRVAAATGLIAAVLAVAAAVGAEVADHDSSTPATCTAAALSDYMYLYDDGLITHNEYEVLRADAIDDEVNDVSECP